MTKLAKKLTGNWTSNVKIVVIFILISLLTFSIIISYSFVKYKTLYDLETAENRCEGLISNTEMNRISYYFGEQANAHVTAHAYVSPIGYSMNVKPDVDKLHCSNKILVERVGSDPFNSSILAQFEILVFQDADLPSLDKLVLSLSTGMQINEQEKLFLYINDSYASYAYEVQNNLVFIISDSSIVQLLEEDTIERFVEKDSLKEDEWVKAFRKVRAQIEDKLVDSVFDLASIQSGLYFENDNY